MAAVLPLPVRKHCTVIDGVDLRFSEPKRVIANSSGVRLSELPIATPPLDVQAVHSQRNLLDVRRGPQEIIL